MTNEAWLMGLKKLVLAFPDRDMSPGYAQERGDLYRTHLDDLADRAWLHAVAEAIQHERWFPTVAALRDYAAGWVPQHALLPPARRTDEQLAADREGARRGLELIRAAVAQAGDPAKAMPGTEPKEPTLVRTTAVRRAELERQRQEISHG